jgi:hypothetical protein
MDMKLKVFKNIGNGLMKLLLVCLCTFFIAHSQGNNVPRMATAETVKKTKESAVKALIEALKDENHEVRKQAAISLGEIKTPHAVEALIATLKDEDPEVRKAAAWALGEIGKYGLEPSKKFGSIVVKSNPPDAWVFLDGKKHEEPTPTVIEKVPVGRKYEIGVTKEGFEPWTEPVEPRPDKSITVKVSLTRLVGTIVVRSDPPGASVFLDGVKHKELTPTVIQKLRVGQICKIRVEKKGFKEWSAIVEPQADKPLIVEAILTKLDKATK